MTHNVDRETLKDLIFEEGWDLSTVRSYHIADVLLATYDVTEKPVPIGTIRMSNDQDTFYIKTTHETWAAVYINHAGYTQVLRSATELWGDVEVYRP